jgi:hypothetical protein
MWLIALGYPLGQLLTTILKVRADPFSIFDRGYLLFTVLILPPVLVGLAIWLGARRHGPSWDWTFVLVLWIVAVAFTHYVFVGVASGGV